MDQGYYYIPRVEHLQANSEEGYAGAARDYDIGSSAPREERIVNGNHTIQIRYSAWVREPGDEEAIEFWEDVGIIGGTIYGLAAGPGAVVLSPLSAVLARRKFGEIAEGYYGGSGIEWTWDIAYGCLPKEGGGFRIAYGNRWRAARRWGRLPLVLAYKYRK